MPETKRRQRKPQADFAFERQQYLAGNLDVIGIDEAGIGPWAGPVVAAAVRLDPNAIPAGLADSKTLTASRRERCFEDIMKLASVGVGIAEVPLIDSINVLRACHAAMAEAVRGLAFKAGFALVDGKHLPPLDCPALAVIDGDAKVLSIAAASIIAKVTRDRIMTDLARTYLGYGFEKHKGYGTAAHSAAIARLGVTPIHRRSFKPIQLALAAAANPMPLTHGGAKSA